MGKYKVEIQPTAEKDLSKHKKSGNKATQLKIIKILDELTEHPYTGTGKPELLKYELEGFWSRRINQKKTDLYTRFMKILLPFLFFPHGDIIQISN